MAERQARQERGEKVGGRPPVPPSPEPKPTEQYNFTDPESRIMKAGSGEHFEQAYNAQAAVEVDSRLIVGERVSQAPNDKQELLPTVGSIPSEAGSVAAVLTDSGFFSEQAVKQIEQTPEGPPTSTMVYAPLDERSHHRSVADLEQKPEPEPPPEGASLSAESGLRIRLPSEAEWEYACRARTGGDFAGPLDDLAWYEANSGGTSHPVWHKKPNAWSLSDMLGNVAEWCEDAWHDTYNSDVPPLDGSAWVPPTLDQRVLRGGHCGCGPQTKLLTAYSREPAGRDYASTQVGFRVVWTE